ncbi:NADH-quinone oxidoreductase subunit J family protein [Aquirufa antheringensis]|jgi:NADH-quinone oxidoreductase subunit J|uniref:NADH-quinone oxidoreductase subunit J n=1 Tax=Aquirufa antheringensis TaxID=2516559 RepID=A0A4Q9BEN3_9BACT|nr:NADH-quinone oxidoreductase subunit J [Aquirufa antheringensis]MCE4217104.1 NADH-quinone oxidoreductase subunit J [Pseudarcicella sp. GAP-15]MCZ2484356.1 NADH-quinone oxidoreductase subunit J [Aquirufa antheringensis]MCZ2487775.1 NADH-quinone oxidoreductase subunit J [Aquirufa antheringensis]MCZ2489400.1 NADH-quinone oxidoreductase subunit J [Aquirufa antheringensis]TBH72631.1 NADH-quinone oxidoreductase subunit J [Aquirufa antheringensis]
MEISNIWYFLSGLTLLSALMVVLAKNPIHSVLYLVFTFFCISGHYVLLNAQFLMAVNIIVYAGAIMVLFLFVIMMFDLRKNQPESKSNLTKLAGSVVAGSLLVVLIALVRQNNFQTPQVEGFVSQTGMVENLGKVLYSEYLLPFELVSILFFVAMVGAVLLGKREAGERNF